MNQSGLFKKIIGALSLTSIVLFGAIYFVYNQIKTKNEKILNIEQDLLSKNTKHDYLISLQKLVESIDPEIKKVESSFIPKGGDVAFIEELELLARNSNLNVEIESLNLTSDPKNDSSPLATLKVKAKASGLWSDIYKFIYEMESLKYKIKINKFSIFNKQELTSIRDIKQNNEWQINFEISVLEYK